MDQKDNQSTSDVLKIIEILSTPDSYQLVYHSALMNEEMLSVNEIIKIMETIKEIIFPGYFGNNAVRIDNIRFHIGISIDKLHRMLITQLRRGFCFECEHGANESCDGCDVNVSDIAKKFMNKLPEIRKKLATDVQAMLKYDPAATSYGEIIFAYPAIKALTNYRVAHELFILNVPIIPRIITELAHSETGIDIHPGAQIDEFFCIDHGTGVVIGETTIIGKNVRIYQGVTLGSKSFPTDKNGNPLKVPRHPILEDDVIIYSGATILGRITIGKGSEIGGNVWVTNNVPPNSRIVQNKPREFGFMDGGGI